MGGMLAEWNGMEAEAAAEAVLPCCGSRAWAARMVEARPVGSAEELYATSDLVWGTVSMEDWVEAFESHPRIGETHAEAAEQSLEWSEGEQSKAMAEIGAQAALADGNRRYEEQFGMIFIVCASGKTAGEMLEILEKRLENDEETEMMEAAEQQRQITQLRLRKWLGEA